MYIMFINIYNGTQCNIFEGHGCLITASIVIVIGL